MTTPKKNATMLRLEAHLAPLVRNLAYPVEGIINDAHLSLHDAIESADSEETIQAYIDDWFKERPHLFRVAYVIPKAMQQAAFGEHCTLKGQGDLIKRYGEAAAAEAARDWGTRLGSTKPGVDPNSNVTVAEAKKALAKAQAEAPSRNPWADAYPAKTPAERFAAQAGVIKAMGSKAAIRMARSAGKTLAGAPMRK